MYGLTKNNKHPARSQALVRLMRRQKLYQSHVAEMCDVSIKAVNNWCGGRTKPPLILIKYLQARLRIEELEEQLIGINHQTERV